MKMSYREIKSNNICDDKKGKTNGNKVIGHTNNGSPAWSGQTET